MTESSQQQDHLHPETAEESLMQVIILTLAAITGAAALINEVSWSRQVGLLLGQTAQTSAIVLASYFLGMAIGYAGSTRWLGAVRPLLGFGICELLAGCFALLVPSALKCCRGLLFLSKHGFDASSRTVQLVMVLGVGLSLLPATIAMGASWPFIAVWAKSSGHSSGTRITSVYSANTIGAFLGVIGTTGFLLVEIGVVASNYAAALSAVVAGGIAIILGLQKRYIKCENAIQLSNKSIKMNNVPMCRLGAIAAVSGFTILSTQVLGQKLFALVFHNSTYTFGLIVAVCLVAMSMASAFVSRANLKGRYQNWIGSISLLGAAWLGLSVLAFIHYSDLRYFQAGWSFASYLLGAVALVILVLFPPLFMMGLLLPSVWEWSSHGASSELGGQRVGRLTALNAVASGVGSIISSQVMLPQFGLWNSLAITTGVLGALGAVFWKAPKRWIGFLSNLAIIGIVFALTCLPESISLLPQGSDARVMKKWEGMYGRVDIIETSPTEQILRLNLHYGLGATGESATREYRQGHMPLLLHPEPERVLFLGLGTGLTSASALDHEEVRSVEIVELIPEVVEAAASFREANLGILENPKARVRINDARHHLDSTSEKYDIIVSDLFIPWESLTGYLYTVDFYESAKRRLEDDGFFCQWLALYQLSNTDFERIANSFASVFPEVNLWWGRLSANSAVLALVGSDEPLKIDLEAIEQRISDLKMTGGYRDPYLTPSGQFARLYGGNWVKQPGSPLNTDEHPWVEFRAPVYHRGNLLLIEERLLKFFDQTIKPSKLPSQGVEGDESNLQLPLRRLEATRVWQRRMILNDEGARGEIRKDER